MHISYELEVYLFIYLFSYDKEDYKKRHTQNVYIVNYY